MAEDEIAAASLLTLRLRKLASLASVLRRGSLKEVSMKSQRRHTNLLAGLVFIPYLLAATCVAQSLPAPRTVDLSAFA